MWPPEPGARIPAIAAAVLSASAFLSTVAVNVPLNNALDAASAADAAVARTAFEQRWNRWNLVRTITTAAALIALAAAALPL